MVDRQSIELLPLFGHARQSYLLDCDRPLVQNTAPPSFPGSSKLSPAEQDDAKILYLSMSLAALYKTLFCRGNQRLYHAMECRQTRYFELLLLAQNILVDGEDLYKVIVLELEREWPSLPIVQACESPPFPNHLSPDRV